MATIKWSAFTSGTTIGGSDITVGLQSGANVQWTMTQLKTWTSASPTLVTPTLGVATATSINKVALTAPATGSTLTIADGKTLTANNSITIAGTDSTTITFGSASSSFPIVTSPSAAIFQLGATDAASPVAQTLQFQSVSNGTSNVASVDATFNLSVGTGTGAGGKLLMFGGVTGSSGSTPNSRVRNFEFVPATSVASGGAVFKVYREADSGATNTSFGYMEAGVTANTLILGSNKVGSPSVALTKLQINVDGTNRADFAVTTAGVWTFTGSVNASNLLMPNGGQFYWASRSLITSPADGVVYITRNNGTSAGTVRVGTQTVASLPSAVTYPGSLAIVSDATATTPRSTVAGGGSNICVVFSDGTNWLIAA